MLEQDHIQRTIAMYDVIAKEYAKNVAKRNPEEEAQTFISLLPEHGTILDAGCGSGRDSGYFVEKEFDVVGVDLSEKLLEIAQQENPAVLFLKQDLRHLDFPKESFDGIWACASLLHLKRTEVPDVLNQFHALLKPDGILFILVKLGDGEADVAEALSSGISRHFTYFQPEELNSMLMEEGFTIENTVAYNEKERDVQKRDLWWIASFSKK